MDKSERMKNEVRIFLNIVNRLCRYSNRSKLAIYRVFKKLCECYLVDKFNGFRKKQIEMIELGFEDKYLIKIPRYLPRYSKKVLKCE